MRRPGRSTSWRRCEPGPGIAALHAALRELSPHLDDDRSLSAEIEAVAAAIRDGSLVAAVEPAFRPAALAVTTVTNRQRPGRRRVRIEFDS